MNIERIVKGTLRAVLRILVFLIAMETFFWVGGILTEQAKSFGRHVRLQQRSDVTIICLGDSVTAAGNSASYPLQLEQILNERDSNRTYRVFNLARGGQDSSYSAGNILHWRREYHPDYVVTMFGAFDPRAQDEGRESRFVRALQSLRIVQIIDVFRKRVSRSEHLQEEEKEEPAKSQIKIIWNAVEQLPPVKKVVAQMALYANAMGRLSQAENLYRRIMEFEELKKVLPYLHESLANILWQQKKYAEYAEELKNVSYYSWEGGVYETLCVHPDFRKKILEAITIRQDKKPDEPYYEDMMAACYEAGGEKEQTVVHQRKARQLRLKQKNPYTRKAYRDLLNILADDPDIQPVLVQYPRRDLDALKLVVQDAPGYDHLIFVDNQRNFEEALQEYVYDELFFDRAAGDFGHGTTVGNRLIAESIADAILQSIKSRQ